MGRQLLTSAGLIKFLVLSVLVSGVKCLSVKCSSVKSVRLINFLDQLVTLTQFAQYLKNSS